MGRPFSQRSLLSPEPWHGQFPLPACPVLFLGNLDNVLSAFVEGASFSGKPSLTPLPTCACLGLGLGALWLVMRGPVPPCGYCLRSGGWVGFGWGQSLLPGSSSLHQSSPQEAWCLSLLPSYGDGRLEQLRATAALQPGSRVQVQGLEDGSCSGAKRERVWLQMLCDLDLLGP